MLLKRSWRRWRMLLLKQNTDASNTTGATIATQEARLVQVCVQVVLCPLVAFCQSNNDVFLFVPSKNQPGNASLKPRSNQNTGRTKYRYVWCTLFDFCSMTLTAVYFFLFRIIGLLHLPSFTIHMIERSGTIRVIKRSGMLVAKSTQMRKVVLEVTTPARTMRVSLPTVEMPVGV